MGILPMSSMGILPMSLPLLFLITSNKKNKKQKKQ